MKPATAPPAVLYLLAAEPSRQAVRAALMAMNVLPMEAAAGIVGLLQLRDALAAHPEWMAIVDLQAQAPPHHPLALVSLVQDQDVRARIVLARGNAGPVWDADRNWIRGLGFCDLVADVDCTALLADAACVLEHIAHHTGAGLAMAPRLRQYFSAMQVKPDSATPRALIRRLTNGSAEQLCAALAQGADTADRKHNTTLYPACFIARDAVGWISGRYGVTRPNAVALGQALQSLGMVHHVVHEQAFADAHLFFRTAWLPEAGHLLPGAVLHHLQGAKGVAVRDRSYRARTFAACFVGSEAVDQINAWTALPRHACETVLNRLHRFGMVEHVTGEHPVRDGNFYYRFTDGLTRFDAS